MFRPTESCLATRILAFDFSRPNSGPVEKRSSYKSSATHATAFSASNGWMGDQHRLNQIMKTLLTLLCGGLLIVGQTYAQTSSRNNRSMTKDSANTTSRSVTDNRGTVVDYSRNSILIDDSNG